MQHTVTSLMRLPDRGMPTCRRAHRQHRLRLLLAAALTMAAAAASATDYTWVTPENGLWTDPTKWGSATGFPGSLPGDSATISVGGGITVTVPATTSGISIDALTLGNPTLILELDSGSLEVGSGFTNPGTIRMTAITASGNTALNVDGTVLNTGEIRTEIGLGGFRNLEATAITSSGSMGFDADTSFATTSAVMTNTGSFDIGAGIDVTLAANFQTFNQDAGMLTIGVGGSFLMLVGSFHYTGGTIVGVPELRGSELTIAPTATEPAIFRITAGGAAPSLVGDPLAGHTIRIDDAGLGSDDVTNAGTIELIGTTNAVFGAAASTVTNLGTFHAMNAIQSQIKAATFDNDGLVDIDAFTNFNQGGSTFANTGVVDIAPGAELRVIQSYVQTAGTTRVDGLLNLTNSLEDLVLSGGVLRGDGSVSADVVLGGSGEINPGCCSPGRLEIAGDLAMTGGTLRIEATGTAPGAFDRLEITASGSADFSGGGILFAFENGYAPQTGDTFTFLTAAGGIADTSFSTAVEGVAPGFTFDVSAVGGSLVFEALSDAVPTSIFANGFESGDTSAWSATVP